MQCDKREKFFRNQVQNNKSNLNPNKKSRNDLIKMNLERRQSSLISDLQCSLPRFNPKLNDLSSIFLSESEIQLKGRKISMMMIYLLEDRSLWTEKCRFKLLWMVKLMSKKDVIFSLSWLELRSLWSRNETDLNRKLRTGRVKSSFCKRNLNSKFNSRIKSMSKDKNESMI